MLLAAQRTALQHVRLVPALCHALRPLSTGPPPPASTPAAEQPGVLQQPVLYREFIQQSLYHPVLGYFNRPSPPLQRLPQPLAFHRMLNQAEYRLELARAYQRLQVDWLTPVEVFAPWYGRAIAHYMLEARAHSGAGGGGPLAVVEVGGGTGTLAASVLDYVSEKDPIAYSNMSYTTIEISASLAALQQQYIAKERGHSQPWRLVRGDASQPGTWQQVAAGLASHHSLQEQHCFVLMLEVLDNLPHDRVVRQDLDSPWQQVMVAAAPGQQQQQQQQQQYIEQLEPATDPLIQRCLAALCPPSSSSGGDGGDSSDAHGGSASSGGGGGSSRVLSWLHDVFGLQTRQDDACDVWLPTRCLQLLETLHAAAPQHTLLAADFDALPDIRLPGRNAPLVSGRSAPGVVRDYGSALVPWGAADIFFPTNFDDLGRLYAAAAARQQQRHEVSSSHSSTADFMAAFAEAKHTRTLTGYNPLVQDWLNTRVFVGQAGGAAAAAAAAEE